MVQYIFTPWRDRRELLAVRRQFYPALDGETRAAGPEVVQRVEAGQHAAVARVAVWMQRGHCPHMVESTALLMAAVLADAGASSPRGLAASPSISPNAAGSMESSSSAYAARATYAAAFSRFVTGLLDGQQDRARKLSMHGLAQTVGLPPGFVELRHQATHEALPALRRLRVAARQALAWIWGYYWANMEDVEPAVEAAAAAETTAATTKTEANDDTGMGLRETLLQYVDSEDPSTSIPSSLVSTWGEAVVLAELAALGAEEEGRALRCIRLSRRLLQKEQKDDVKQDTSPTGTVSKTKTKTQAKAKAKPATASQATTPAKEAAKPESTETASAAPSWTMGNLNLEAMRAAMAQSRQALYHEGDEEAEESKKKDEEVEEHDENEDQQEDEDQNNGGDVVMAEDEPEQKATTREPELPSRNPRWTRYAGEWTPKPIGVV